MHEYEKEFILKGFCNIKIDINFINDGKFNIVFIKATNKEKALKYAKSSYPFFKVIKIYELVERF